MHKKFLLPILLGFSFCSFAQKGVAPEFNTEIARGMTDVFNNGYDVVSYNLRSNAIQGSPMLMPYWTQGEILLVGNSKAVQVPVKYDLYRQQLRVKRSQGDSIVVPAARVQQFSLHTLDNSGSKQEQRFIRYESPSLPADMNGTFAEVISNGKHLQLLKFWRKTVVKVSQNSTNMALQNTVRSFNDNAKYYLRWVDDGRVAEVRPKRASLKAALAGQPAALIALAEYKNKLSSESDLSTAVTAIDPAVGK
jgi:virulence-associated protein VagC